MAASLVSLNKAPILSLSIVGSQFFTLSRFIVFNPPVGLFSNYMGNLSISSTLQVCVIGTFVSKLGLIHFFCPAHCSRIKTFVNHSTVSLNFCVSHSLVSVHYIMYLTYLVLDDGGCFNAFFPMDLFLSTKTHLALGMRFRVL